MTNEKECKQHIDTLKLIHQGTSQDNRISAQLNPTYAQVDERKIEDTVVFAKAYAKYLRFYGGNNTVIGDWEAFFSRDVSVQLAIAAIQDVEYYKSNVKTSFDFLNNRENENKVRELKKHLGYLFSYVGTLAKQLDELKQGLPTENTLKDSLQNQIQSRLAPTLNRLIAYYKADLILPAPHPIIADAHSDIMILESKTVLFRSIYDIGLTNDWIVGDDNDWRAYKNNIKVDATVYGTETEVFKSINHIATHNLFSAVFDQFLKVFARVVVEAKAELEKTFSNWDKHEPHYALFLSFLKLFDYARTETNTLTQRHLDFYYRDILKLKEKPAESSHAHLLIELAKHVDAHEIKADELFRAGKDDLGVDVLFANDNGRNFVANQAKVTELKTLYRHKNIPNETLAFQDNRLFASPVANSADGLGAKLTTTDQSWHPFSNKIYENGKLTEINMPQAEIGFAIASHYLWMAEGERTITLDFTMSGTAATLTTDHKEAIICFVTTEKGWLEKTAIMFITESRVLKLKLALSGGDPAVTPYSPKTHRYNFSTNLPVLLVKLRHSDNAEYIYRLVQDMVIETIGITVAVTGLKSLAVSNDLGPVDTSKPFQPFGAQPVAGNSAIFGSREIFQKNCQTAKLKVAWQNLPTTEIIGYKKDATPTIDIASLSGSAWDTKTENLPFSNPSFPFSSNIEPIFPQQPDFSANEFFYTSARNGFTRLSLNDDFGQVAYLNDLRAYLIAQSKTPPGGNNPGNPPYIPAITSVSADYTTAAQSIALDASVSTEISFDKRPAKFYHLYPFGHAEQHPWLKNKAQAFDPKIYLVPQFYYESILQEKAYDAEFYIGITGLKPPQNLALLFQVADGTADPLLEKPKRHIHWSYLGNNEWLSFDIYEVQDDTDGLINSGIITFAIPDKATSANTMLPSGQHWLRAAVAEKSDAVCKLLAVSAQGLKVTFQNQNNAPSFLAKTLPAETINKLKQTDAAVKKVSQPFASFGGRAAEQPQAFYTRISERLRHKDRTITLWDYEHLILEAFPQVYQVKCLNHTQYDPDEKGSGTYNELAPGHITVVTIPNQQFHNLHDPLRPYTSLGLLAEIEVFLKKKLSCFVKPHVKNPQFEEVRVSFKVKFYAGFDVTFYKKTLNTAITHFLSPWAFSGGGNPTFGGKVYLSTLINFVEQQPYVDYVTNFTFIKPEPDENILHVNEIAGSKAVSILVSAKHHKIDDVLDSDEEGGSGETCPCASL